MRVTILLILLITIAGCQIKPKSDRDKVFDNYSSYQGSKKNDTIFYTYKGATYKLCIDTSKATKTIQKIYGFMANNPNTYGPFFKFDTFGKLDKYYFMSGDGEHDLYDITFNSEKDKYEEQGNIYVDYLAPYTISDSGNNYTFIFSTFPRKNLEVFYSLDKIHYDTLHLTKKRAIPFIADGDIILTRNEINQGIFIKVKAANLIVNLKGLDNTKETIDTVDFKQNH